MKEPATSLADTAGEPFTLKAELPQWFVEAEAAGLVERTGGAFTMKGYRHTAIVTDAGRAALAEKEGMR